MVNGIYLCFQLFPDQLKAQINIDLNIFFYAFSYSQINWGVKYLMKVVTEMGNLFLATSHELVAFDTCDVMEHVVAMSLSKISEVGKTLH